MSRRQTQTSMLMIVLGIVVALALSLGLVPSTLMSFFAITPVASFYPSTPGGLNFATLLPSGPGISIQIGPSRPTDIWGPTPFSIVPVIGGSSPVPPAPSICSMPTGWRTYTVQPGDTLGALANPTGLSVQQLAAINCLSNADNLQVGQVIYLPTVRATSTPLG